jgi:hypothetical protein
LRVKFALLAWNAPKARPQMFRGNVPINSVSTHGFSILQTSGLVPPAPLAHGHAGAALEETCEVGGGIEADKPRNLT